MITEEKQFFPLRISILYCLQCYLYKNDYGKSIIIQTLLPQSEQCLYSLEREMFFFHLIDILASNQYSLGYLLIIGYLSKDIIASWCSSIALAHVIADNEQYKEEFLKINLAVDPSQPSTKSLMEISIDLLENVILPSVR